MEPKIKHAIYSALIFPGMGQFKNGQKSKGLIFSAMAMAVIFGLAIHFAIMMIDYFGALAQFADPFFNGSAFQFMKQFWARLLWAFLAWGLLGILVWGASGLDAYMNAKDLPIETASTGVPPSVGKTSAGSDSPAKKDQ